MGQVFHHLRELPMDILFEILGHLSPDDILQARKVCRRLCQATLQRTVWVTAYEKSNLLLPEGPLPSQSSLQLEKALLRAMKVNRNWTSPDPPRFIRRRFPHELPTYDFDANIIAGRFLQVVLRDNISWYDLDSNDISIPVLKYHCPTIMPMTGYLNYQVNANGEGPDTVWVTFMCQNPKRITILKVNFAKAGNKVRLHAEIQAGNVTSVKMGHDWILPIREFISPDEHMDLFHIPSKSILYVPMHENVQNLSHLSSMNYAITPQHLFLAFSLRDETSMNVYTLPKNFDNLSSRDLPRTHTGIYPHAISKLQVFETSPNRNGYVLSPTSQAEDVRVSFLALVYVNRSATSWTCRIGLNLIDAHLSANGSLTFATDFRRTLKVGIATTVLSLSARSGKCLAVTHSMPGPVVLAHTISKQESGTTMNVKVLKLPPGLQSRDMLAFDGIRGRLCLIHGWSSIEILDCA